MTVSSTRKRQRRKNSDDEDEIDRKTSITESVEDETICSSPEIVRSSSKRKRKRSHVEDSSDSEDSGEDIPVATCGNVWPPDGNNCTASAKKAKKKKALESLKKRERRAGGLSDKTSLDDEYNNEGSVSPKSFTEEEEDEEESGSDMDDFVVEDSQSQDPELKTCLFTLATLYLSPVPDPTTWKFLSLNVRGLKNKKKRSSIFSYLKDQNCHFYFLQETYSEPKDENVWTSEWGGKILFSHGTSRKKGVCILISLQFNGFQIEYDCNNSQGRIILANININSVQISLCNIYAPNKLQEQNTFVKDLNQFLHSNANVSQLIVGGDWNVALSATDKKSRIPWRRTTYRDLIIGMCEEFDLIDILRKKKPNARLFTFESKPKKMKSRIDYFLIANSMSHLVSNVNIGVSIAPDHRAVTLNVNLTSNKPGPGLWKFNNSLLFDNEFVSLIETSYSAISKKLCELDDKQLNWEMIKMELRSLIIQYVKAQKSSDYQESLEQRLEEMKEFINNSNECDGNLERKLTVQEQLKKEEMKEFINNSNECDGNLERKLTVQEQLKKELKCIYKKKGEAAMFRSKLRWTEQREKPGEKPTSTCGNVWQPDGNNCTASAKKAKKQKALESLKKRERRAGGLSDKTSLDDEYNNEGSSSPKSFTEEEEDEEESGSDRDDFVVEDSQSQDSELPVFAYLDLDEAYKRLVQMFLSSSLDNDFLSLLHDEQNPYFGEAKRAIERAIESKKNLVGSTTWKEFKEFSVGRFIAERESLYHDLHHHCSHLKQSCIDKINKARETMGTASDENIVECCIDDEDWLNILLKTFKALLRKADNWAKDGYKTKEMKAYCSNCF